MDSKDIVQIAKALGDPIRWEILQVLRGREKCVCELLEVFELKQPNLSYHLKILSEAGLLIGRQDGKWNHYKVDEVTLREFSKSIIDI